MSLLVVGTLAFDSVETPFGKRDDTLGGSATYLANAASYFCDVQMVGVVGEDFPEEHLDFCRSRGIDTAGVTRLPGRTFRWAGRYEYDLNVRHTLDTQLNVLNDFEPVLPEPYKKARYVVLGNMAPEVQSKVLDQVESPQLVAADTMNFWIEGTPDALKATLARVDLLSVNDAEARQLSGEYNLVRAAQVIRDMGPKVIIVKRGEHGATVFTDEDIFMTPAYPILEILDPTGAGDSFAGGMMGYLTHRDHFDGATLRQAAVLGSVTASFAVEDFSLDRFRSLKRAEIRDRFLSFRDLTHFDANGATLWSDG